PAGRAFVPACGLACDCPRLLCGLDLDHEHDVLLPARSERELLRLEPGRLYRTGIAAPRRPITELELDRLLPATLVLHRDRHDAPLAEPRVDGEVDVSQAAEALAGVGAAAAAGVVAAVVLVPVVAATAVPVVAGPVRRARRGRRGLAGPGRGHPRPPLRRRHPPQFAVAPI